MSEQLIEAVPLPVVAASGYDLPASDEDDPVVAPTEPAPPPLADGKMSWSQEAKFLGAHVVAAIGAWYIPPTREVILLGVAAYFVRMFFITAGYHRYFAHRAFKTSRWFQFVLALGGATASQKGAMWWASHHRHHHKYSDMPEDTHSPVQRGLWWAHMGWILSPKFKPTRWDLMKDFERFPELRFLNRAWILPPLVGGGVLYLLGGMPYVVWVGLVSTVVLWHGTFTINSLAHVFGKRRFATTDTSKNSLILALITLGEGWHNNHHYYQSSANQGFRWFELDVSFEVLRVLSWLGIVWDLRRPPARVLAEAQPDAPILQKATATASR